MATSKTPTVINILLIGKTGHGKSSTGNTILQKQECFKVSNGCNSETPKVQLEQSFNFINNVTFNVVDMPGFSDTEIGRSKTLGQFIGYITEEIYSVFNKCPLGFDVLMYVYRKDERFRVEENDVFETAKLLFGERALRDFGVLAITSINAESLEEWKNNTIMEATKEKDKRILDFLQTFAKRIVSFNNKSNDDKKNKQIEALVQVITQLKSNDNPRYTKETFENAKIGRLRLIVSDKMPEAETIAKQTKQMIQQKIRGQNTELEELEEIKQYTEQKLKSIKELDQNTNVLETFIKSLENEVDYVNSIITLKKSQKEIKQKEEEEKKKIKAQSEENRRQEQEQNRRLEEMRNEAFHNDIVQVAQNVINVGMQLLLRSFF